MPNRVQDESLSEKAVITKMDRAEIPVYHTIAVFVYLIGLFK